MAWCNPDIFMESIPPVSIDIMCYVKLFNFMYHGDKVYIPIKILYTERILWQFLPHLVW